MFSCQKSLCILVTLSNFPSHLFCFTSVMSSSSEEHTVSDGDLPLYPSKSERFRMAGGGKSLKHPKVPTKNQESESEEMEEEIPSANTQSDDDAITNALTIFFDRNPKKGGHRREKNTIAEMSEPDGYRTPPGEESTLDHNNGLQRICRHWASKWFRYENVRKKFLILFAFNPHWNVCIAKNCIGQNDEKVRMPPPADAQRDSLKTIEDFPEEVAKRGKAKAKHEAKEVKKKQVEAKNVKLAKEDVLKKEQASASKGSKSKKYVSP